MTDLTVACVLRSGGIYDAEWVRKLRDGVARNLSLPHRFVCLSDVDVPCERVPLATGWKGWWSKIELFRELTGHTLYFDLDSVVVGSLDRIAEYPHRFTMSHDFYHGNPCSTAMAWNGDYSFIYEMFKDNPAGYAKYYDGLLAKEKRIGDQAFIEDCLKKRGLPIDFFQNVTGRYSVASYKVDKCDKALPPDAGVVAMHGRPKPHQLGHIKWVKEHWR